MIRIAIGAARRSRAGFARASVAVVDINETAGHTVAATCAGEAKAYRCDVADPAAVRETFAAVDSDLGPVDVLVNNAGIVRLDPEAGQRALANLQAARSGGILPLTENTVEKRSDRMKTAPMIIPIAR